MTANTTTETSKPRTLYAVLEDCFWTAVIVMVALTIVVLIVAHSTTSPVPLIRSNPYVVQLPDKTFNVCHTVVAQRFCVYKPSATTVERSWRPASEVSGPGYPTVAAARASWPFNNAHYGQKVN